MKSKKGLEKTQRYFEERLKAIEKSKFNNSKKCYYNVIEALESVEKDLNGQMAKWIKRFEVNNKVDYSKALELLKNEELEEFKWNVHEYIKYAKENELTGKYIKQLENASAKWHINRLEAMKLQIRAEVEILNNEIENKVSENIDKVYKDGFYKTIFEIDKIRGFESFSVINDDMLKILKKKPWADDGKNFSDRLWRNKEEMVNQLQQEIIKICVLGEPPQKSVKTMQMFLKNEIEKRKYQTARLIMTEASYFYGQATFNSYKEREVEEYEILATLDLKTSPKCQEMDRKVFKTSEKKVGINAPPFHVNCRTTTMPVISDRLKKHFEKTRIAREEKGKNYYVEGDLNYKEWYEKYVLQAEDREEYNKYKNVVSSKYFPETLEKFRELKYNNDEAWFKLENEYKTINSIKNKTWNEPFKEKAIKTYYDFKEIGLETSDHFLARFLQRKNDKITMKAIREIRKKEINFIEVKNDNNIRFYDGLRLVTNENDNVLVTVTFNVKAEETIEEKLKERKWKRVLL